MFFQFRVKLKTIYFTNEFRKKLFLALVYLEPIPKKILCLVQKYTRLSLASDTKSSGKGSKKRSFS